MMFKRILRGTAEREWTKPTFYATRAPRPEGVVDVEYSIFEFEFDAIVVGGGAAGLTAAIHLSESGFHTALLSKLYPTRSHTVLATSGISASLSNMCRDDWKFHYFDTQNRSFGLSDPQSAQILCESAASSIYSLENIGMLFSRNSSGRILQEKSEGETLDYGGSDAIRKVVAGDRIGHHLLQVSMSRAMAVNVRLLVDYVVLEMIVKDNQCRGVVAWDLRMGAIHVLRANAVLMATGGFGQAFSHTTQSASCTGDGQALVSKAGLANQDLELVAFHPLSLYRTNFMVPLKALTGGGKLVNEELNEVALDRDSKGNVDQVVLAQRMMKEMKNQTIKHLWLDLRGFSVWELEKMCPRLTGTVKALAGLDVSKDLIPVVPGAHFNLGGIPTDCKGRVIINSKGEVMPGLYAAGEAACTSAHGASYLPHNSLLEAIVFGKAAAKTITETIKPYEAQEPIPPYIAEEVAEKIDKIRASKGTFKVPEIRKSLQKIMSNCGAAIRDKNSLKEGLIKIEELTQMMKDLRTINRGILYNMEVVETFELENLIIMAKQTLVAASVREESRGVHCREDFIEEREEFRKHTLTWLQSMDGEVGIDFRAVAGSAGTSKDK